MAKRLLVRAIVVFLCSHAGCSNQKSSADPCAAEGTSLVDHNAWSALSSEQDPFSDRLPTVYCPDGTYGEETGWFEVETDKCNYITAMQNSLIDVCEGQSLNLVLWHLPLGGSETAEAHVVVRIGETTVFERTVAVPSPAEVFEEIVPLDQPVEAGTPIYFHLHNHGNNSWRLLNVAVDDSK